jgi:hypothetical protein
MADNCEVPRIQDKALNDAILSNDIGFDFLPFIELCHRHYADEVDLTFGRAPTHRRTRYASRNVDELSIADSFGLRDGRGGGDGRSTTHYQ